MAVRDIRGNRNLQFGVQESPQTVLQSNIDAEVASRIEGDLIIPVANISLMVEVGRIYELTADESPNLQYDTFKVASDGTLVKL